MSLSTTTAALSLTALLVPLLGGTPEARGATRSQETQAVDAPTVEDLTGKSFRFSWKQDDTGGFNGILVLAEGGRIEGINSPNESSWKIDEEGRLLILHEDGNVSTTFEVFEIRDGKWCFDGPFHLREGITHHLEETDEEPRQPVHLDEGLPERLLHTGQTIVCLDIGEEYVYELSNGDEIPIKLKSVEVTRDSVVGLVRSAEVVVELIGFQSRTLRCAPYVMPSVHHWRAFRSPTPSRSHYRHGSFRIQVDTTSDWVELPKRVQLSLWDASEPNVDTSRFGFPLRDYRLFVHGMQCYNEPVHLGCKDGDPSGAVFHHSYGIDFAGFEGEMDVLACVEGKVVRLLPDAILVNIEDDAGLIWEYHHLASISPHLREGMRVGKGEKIGVLGRSGPSGNFSHLHVGAYLTPQHMEAGRYTRRLNWYPWMIEAYRELHPEGPLAIAGAHLPVRVGETVTFDGRDSIAGVHGISSYRWELPDGTIVEDHRAEASFEKPGVYVATLTIRDWGGAEDVDFRKIKVYSEGEPEPFLPAIFATTTPTVEVYAGEPVKFRYWLHGAEEHPFEIDFGDGTKLDDYESFTVVEHAFAKPGLHIVTARAEVDGSPATRKQKVAVQPARGVAAGRKPAASREAVIRDWMHQDYMAIELPPELEAEKEHWREQHLTRPEARDDKPVLASLPCFIGYHNAIVEQRMIGRVLRELGEAGAEFFDEAAEFFVELGELRERVERPGSGAHELDPRWKDLYLRACDLRRAKRLAPLLERWPETAFVQHRHVPGSWKYTEGLSDARTWRFFRGGSSLNILHQDGPGIGTVETLIEDEHGVLRNPDVSYDGKRLLFAWKKSDREDDYHLYELDLETRELTQLTEGLGYADFEGVYLPDGDIVFSSTRCAQSVDCNWVEVSNLFAMAGDGRHMRRLGFDQVHTIFPTVTDDGRVLYTRWDYNDRAQIYTQPLFQMNYDGTKQQEFYGGSSWFPTNLIHARQIPGSHLVVGIVTGHHTPAHGKLALIDPTLGRQEAQGVQLIAPKRLTEAIRVDIYGMQGDQFQYPYPLDEERFLVTLALPTSEGKFGRFNLYLVDTEGRRELLVEAPESGEGIGCRQMVPIAPRSVPRIEQSDIDWSADTGTVYIQDIYEGPGLAGVPRGTIDRVRVVGLEYRCAGVGHVDQEGEGGFADVSTPVAVGNASWDVKVVWGSSPVHEDGSAFFEVPARKPLYFQVLDEDGFSVQTMRSWTTLMPGEMQSCVGCHEDKNSAPPTDYGQSRAMAKGAQPLLPFFDEPRGFSYPKDVQPILDRHCTRCHDGREEVPYDLRAELVHREEMKRMINRSYLELTHTGEDDRGDCHHPTLNWIDCMSEPEMLPPYHRGAATSELMSLLKEGHEGVELTAKELETLACWIDLLVPYCGDYLENNTWSERELDFYRHYAEKREAQEAAERKALRELAEAKRGR